MTETVDIQALEKAVKTAKRIASEKASELHDLVEDRLPAAYLDLPAISQATYDACKAWKDAADALAAVQSGV
ncbi:MAG: CCE_0567 family metalloprotein [Pseudomonadota bacterium]